MVYEKSLQLSTYHLSSGAMSTGHVTNHISVDAYNIMYFFYNFNETWAIPIKVRFLIVNLIIIIQFNSIHKTLIKTVQGLIHDSLHGKNM